MQIQPGYEVDLLIGGDFWVVNSGTTQAQPGQKAFAYLASGLVAFATAGTIFGGASATASSVAASTFSVTATIAPTSGTVFGGANSGANSIMTVTTVGSGTVVAGASVSGTGIPTLPAPQVVSQLTPLLASEALGGIGRYYLNVGEITFASGAVSGTYGTLTIGTATGTFVVGDVISGTSVVVGTTITQNLTGSGGTGGTMVVNNNTVVSSTTITASVAVETNFVCRSSGLVGEIVKISNFRDAGNN
jgi:hypothetical protein